MLDSLVRVSRRVGEAADLLATDKRPAPARTLAIRDRSNTRRPRSQEPRAPLPKQRNFTLVHGEQTAVRRVKRPRNAAASRADEQAPVKDPGTHP